MPSTPLLQVSEPQGINKNRLRRDPRVSLWRQWSGWMTASCKGRIYCEQATASACEKRLGCTTRVVASCELRGRRPGGDLTAGIGRKIVTSLRTQLFVWLALTVLAVFHARTRAANPVRPKLTGRLKGLLGEEMHQVAHATAELALAITAGDHASANQPGIGVRDSFIPKKSLTVRDENDLMRSVPPLVFYA